jgi:hypothetical protein
MVGEKRKQEQEKIAIVTGSSTKEEIDLQKSPGQIYKRGNR